MDDGLRDLLLQLTLGTGQPAPRTGPRGQADREAIASELLR